MQLINGRVLYSATDLVAAAECEFSVARRLDELLGRRPKADLPDDELMRYAAREGDKHEERVIQRHISELGESPTGVVRMPNPGFRDIMALENGQAATLDAVRAGAGVITQAVLFDGRLLGYADFLIRQQDGSYSVADAKLARRAKVRALLQIAAYHDLARGAGIPVADTGFLLLGDGTETKHDLPEIVPVVHERRAHLDALVESRIEATTTVAWRDAEAVACGRCATCSAEVEASGDVLLVSGMRMTQRARLADVGILSADDLASASFRIDRDVASGRHERPHGITQAALARLQAQARLQVAQMAAERNATTRPGGTPDPQVLFEVFDPMPLAAVPAPSAGDIYFDFEGDPLWRDAEGQFGLEYLFGVVEAPTSAEEPTFVSFLAHTRAQEKKALIDFMAYVAKRREQWPDLHIYHYADYERAALLRLAASHGVCEDEVDDLLRSGVLVDLYPVVKRSIRVSQPSYSLKRLEPLYMGSELRSGNVTNAGDSVVAYAEYCEAIEDRDSDHADRLLTGILDYNEYDCRSTLQLRRWLADRATEHGVRPAAREQSGDSLGAASTAAAEAALVEPLMRWAEPAEGSARTPDQEAMALIAAAVGFHRREDKPYWWGHFHRLSADLEELEDDRDTVVIDEIRVLGDWHRPSPRHNPRRVLELVGNMPTGSELERAGKTNLLYAAPHPDPVQSSGEPGARGWRSAEIRREVTRTDDQGRTVLEVTEVLARGFDPYDHLPVALGPTPGPAAGTVREALHEVAARVLEMLATATPGTSAAVEAVPGPARELLLRQPPRTTSGLPLTPAVDGEFVEPILATVLDLDGSTLSVQGPPGTGKTYVGSHVIASLVNDHGWRVGVVSQGHAVVNNMLDKVVEAGVTPEKVGKKDRPEGCAWTDVASTKTAVFLAQHEGTGCVLGGTAWDFTNLGRVQRGELDLLVVDEAGQYSLAMTLAASVSAQRLLLLGDPQQLPQVSQGSHPEPVDRSALGWLSDGQTLNPEFGYFLDRSWRMHPDLTARVSTHSYEGRLESHLPQTTDRVISDSTGAIVAPGIHVEFVAHEGNSVESVGEARRVLTLVREALTSSIATETATEPRPMRESDVLVVAPFNAQVALIRRTLATAGLADVRVGTVDKFQGQEAPITIVSMTASAPEDVPRGMDFLLSPNRINVAVSRSQVRTTIVRAEALTDFLPASPSGLSELGRFLRLLG